MRASVSGGGVDADFKQPSGQTTAGRSRPAVFLDRDGVLNEDLGYVGEIERFRWCPEAVASIRRFNDAGWYVFVVTNQAGVARGFYPESSVETLHAHMQAELRLAGARIDDFRYCPFHPDGTVERYAKASGWRKPAPGMILDLLAHWAVDRDASLLFGDRDSDMEAAWAAGIAGCLVGPEGLTLALVDGVIDGRLAAKSLSASEPIKASP